MNLSPLSGFQTEQTTQVERAQLVTWQSQQTTRRTRMSSRPTTGWVRVAVVSACYLNMLFAIKTAWLGQGRNERCAVSRKQLTVGWYGVADTVGPWVCACKWFLVLTHTHTHTRMDQCGENFMDRWGDLMERCGDNYMYRWRDFRDRCGENFMYRWGDIYVPMWRELYVPMKRLLWTDVERICLYRWGDFYGTMLRGLYGPMGRALWTVSNYRL